MTRFFPRLVLLAILILLLSMNATSRAQEAHQQPSREAVSVNKRGQALDLGQLDATDYTNSFFELSLSIPKNWLVLDAQTRAALDARIKKLVDSPDQKKLVQIEESMERSKTLLRITKLPIGEPKNAQFMLAAERLVLPSLKTGLDVIQLMKESLKNTNFPIEQLEEARTEAVNGAEFGVVSIKVNSPYGSYMQKIYIAVRNGYALEFFYTYFDDADLPAFAEMMKSVKLK
jgi:hypothetical protein